MSEIEYKMGGDLESVDPEDFSFRVKKKFDKIDKEKVERLNHLGYYGHLKWIDAKARLKSRDLGRWGYKG